MTLLFVIEHRLVGMTSRLVGMTIADPRKLGETREIEIPIPQQAI